MTSGDYNTYSMKAIYKKIPMRSILETKVAHFLDSLEIKWKYEPKVFTLTNGVTLIPDFYLEELNMWLEVKGDMELANKEIWKRFVAEEQTELLMLNGKEVWWLSSREFSQPTCENPYDNLWEDTSIYIGKCSECYKYFFCSMTGIYSCRHCKNHNGDHDLIGFFSSEGEQFDFYSPEEVLHQLKRFKVKI